MAAELQAATTGSDIATLETTIANAEKLGISVTKAKARLSELKVRGVQSLHFVGMQRQRRRQRQRQRQKQMQGTGGDRGIGSRMGHSQMHRP